jgi:hypothetical protein
MSDISQLASRVGRERGSEAITLVYISLHYLAQGEGQRGRLCSFPLDKTNAIVLSSHTAILKRQGRPAKFGYWFGTEHAPLVFSGKGKLKTVRVFIFSSVFNPVHNQRQLDNLTMFLFFNFVYDLLSLALKSDVIDSSLFDFVIGSTS